MRLAVANAGRPAAGAPRRFAYATSMGSIADA
jgi:hypothetical protein